MARGDGGKQLFLTDSDHLLFLDWLDGACKSHGWRIHAWVLMSNHFRLLLETPEPNLVSGAKGALADDRWSSSPSYVKDKGPETSVVDRVLEAFALAKTGREPRA